MTYDESGNNISCPYCGEINDECPHLLAVIDRYFGECEGGIAFERYDEFTLLIANAFQPHLESGSRGNFSWNELALDELWELAAQSYTAEDEEIYLDTDVLTDFVIELMAEAGSEQYDRMSENGGMSCASATALLYAQEPAKALDAALADLNRRLSQGKPIDTKSI